MHFINIVTPSIHQYNLLWKWKHVNQMVHYLQVFTENFHTVVLSCHSYNSFFQKVSVARTLYSRAAKIIMKDSNKKSELNKIKGT